MRISCRISLSGFFLLAALVLFSTPALAQIDLVGEWAPQFHEDNPERLAGPDIGDYAGLPINDAARITADAWNADNGRIEYRRPKGSPLDACGAAAPAAPAQSPLGPRASM